MDTTLSTSEIIEVQANNTESLVDENSQVYIRRVRILATGI